MQEPTHLAAGIVIQKAMRKARPLPLKYFLIAFLALLSHGILDRLANVTYHPPSALPRDWFWISFHVLWPAYLSTFSLNIGKNTRLALFSLFFLISIGLYSIHHISFQFRFLFGKERSSITSSTG